ncbi:MAG: VOC family protein [Flavitalea sp.]
MEKHLAHIAILVKDYDEAIHYYCHVLGFILVEDTILSETKRWVLIKPSNEAQCSLLLAKADGIEQEKFIGNQSGGRVFLFLHTDSFDRDYHAMLTNGVKFVREPQTQPYGRVAVFSDLYGNLWDLIEPKK